MSTNPNPYAPPKAVVADIQPREDSPPLWNPNAAANWSLLFSPAFGAYLHMKNWEALGETAKATAAKTWVIAVVSILVALPLVVVLVPGAAGLQNVTSPLGLVLLISWYTSSGRPQARYVKERFGKDYRRRGWGQPLLMALLALVVYALCRGASGGPSGAYRGQLAHNQRRRVNPPPRPFHIGFCSTEPAPLETCAYS